MRDIEKESMFTDFMLPPNMSLEQMKQMRELHLNNNYYAKYSPASGVESGDEMDDSSSTAIPLYFDYLTDLPPLTEERQIQHAWNPEDASINVYVKPRDPFTLHRHPVAQSTDSIRTKQGYSRGYHLWRIDWNPKERGTHAVVGVATKEAPLHCHGYCSMVGLNEESWGWDLNRLRAVHKSQATQYHPYPEYVDSLRVDPMDTSPPTLPQATQALVECLQLNGTVPEIDSITANNVANANCIVPETIYALLDMEEGNLSFLANGQFLGVAHRNLKGKVLYPTISAVWGHCEISLKYINGLDPEPLPLMHLCRRVVRKRVMQSTNSSRSMPSVSATTESLMEEHMRMDTLDVPEILKNFLKYGMVAYL